MSVATKNPFSVLDPSTDEQPQDAAPIPDEATPPPPPRASTKRGGGPASRGGKYYARGGKPQTTKDSDPPAEEPDNQRKFDAGREAGRGDGRGRGRGRGSGRGRGRPFDRHSQTGKTDSDKKIHQSWGGDDGNTEFKAEQAASWDVAAEPNDWNATPADPVAATDDWGAPATADDWGAPATTNDWGDASAKSAAAPDAWDVAPNPNDAPDADPKQDAGRARKEREPDEEDNTLTLDQYLTQQKDKESAVPKLEGIRKANDGADDVWKGVVPLAKNEEPESYYVGKVKTAPKARAKKDEKVYIEIEARFERPERSGGRGRGRGDRGGGERSDRGRGDRGFGDRGFSDRGFSDRADRGDRGERGRGGRGRGGRGGRQSDENAPASLDVDDPNAFPSLA